MKKLIDTCWCQVQCFFIKSYIFMQNAKKCWRFQKIMTNVRSLSFLIYIYNLLGVLSDCFSSHFCLPIIYLNHNERMPCKGPVYDDHPSLLKLGRFRRLKELIHRFIGYI